MIIASTLDLFTILSDNKTNLLPNPLVTTEKEIRRSYQNKNLSMEASISNNKYANKPSLEKNKNSNIDKPI